MAIKFGSPQVFGSAFVQHYYNVLHSSPEKSMGILSHDFVSGRWVYKSETARKTMVASRRAPLHHAIRRRHSSMPPLGTDYCDLELEIGDWRLEDASDSLYDREMRRGRGHFLTRNLNWQSP
ncbi:hypothetical protein ABZP36_000924 [Zizania latifolia]